MDFSIKFYKTIEGKIPGLEFLRALKKSNQELWEQMNGTLTKIKERQYQRIPFSRPLGSGLNEARAHYIRQQARINYTFEEGRKIILLNGYIKNDTMSEKEGINFGRRLLRELKERRKRNGE